MSPTTVKPNLTPKRLPPKRRTVVENDEFGAFIRRVIRAYGRRIAIGDIETLRDLIALAQEVDQATDSAVEGLREFGYSWADIGNRLGISRQAAHERWGGGRS